MIWVLYASQVSLYLATLAFVADAAGRLLPRSRRHIKMELLWGMVLPLAAVSLAAPPRVRELYGVGAAAWRLLMASAALHHLLYLGFAVVRSTLCVPFFLPAVLYGGRRGSGLRLFY